MKLSPKKTDNWNLCYLKQTSHTKMVICNDIWWILTLKEGYFANKMSIPFGTSQNWPHIRVDITSMTRTCWPHSIIAWLSGRPKFLVPLEEVTRVLVKTVGKAKSKREWDSTRNKTHSVFVIERYQVLGINIMLLCHIQYSAKAWIEQMSSTHAATS